MLSRRPMVILALAFMLGIGVHEFAPHRLAFFMPLLFAAICGAIAFFHRPPLCSAFLIAATFLCGVAASQLEHYRHAADDVCLFASDTPRLAQLEMTIEDPPRIITTPPGLFRALPPRQVTVASVQRVRTWKGPGDESPGSGWRESNGRILLQIDEPHPRLQSGQFVRVIGMLQRPSPAMNPGQFNWADYYREQRVLTSFSIGQVGNIQLIAEPGFSPLAGLRERARRALARGFESPDAIDHALLRALLLGDSDPQLRDVQDQFKRTGTGHHLAISGMHIAVLGGLVFGICRLLCLRPRISAWIGMSFVVLYGFVALPSPPVVRSVLLCLAFGFGVVQRRSLDAIQLLALSVLAMLVYHPMDLYNAGFQLSFGTVLGLMIFTRPLMDWLWREDEDRKVLKGLGYTSRLDDSIHWLKRMALATFCGAIVAWAVSLPLVAYHFEQLNPWAVIGSILLAGPVFAALVAGLLKVILTLLWPSFSGAWAGFASIPVGWMRGMVDWLAAFPGSDVPLPDSSLGAIVCYYVLLSLPLLPCPWSRLRGLLRCSPAGCAVIALPFALGSTAASAGGEMRVTLLAVGAGQCAVVETVEGKVFVLDAGSGSLQDMLRKCFAPFIRHRGKWNVDAMLISHANFDHFSAAADIIESYDVTQILVGPQFVAQSRDNPPAEALLDTLARLKRFPQTVSAGDRLNLGGKTFIDILSPAAGTNSNDSNNASLVFRLTHAGRSILFTGDIQDAGMKRLLESKADLRADVLIAPHHGSAENATSAFLEAVSPKAILSSNDRTLTMKQHEFDRVAARLSSTLRLTPEGSSPNSGERALYRTHVHGAIMVRIGKHGEMKIEPFLSPRQ